MKKESIEKFDDLMRDLSLIELRLRMLGIEEYHKNEKEESNVFWDTVNSLKSITYLFSSFYYKYLES